MTSQQHTCPSDGSEQPNKRPRTERLPTHLLAQHYSRALTGRFSFKRPDWTFYTYFFHRFAGSHSVVLSAISAWTSANLFFIGQASTLDDSVAHYQDGLSSMTEKYNISIQDWEMNNHITGQFDPYAYNEDDLDALFVACFFLALVDLALARSGPLRKIMRFMASVLRDRGFKSNMTGVQARIVSWVSNSPSVIHSSLFSTISSSAFSMARRRHFNQVRAQFCKPWGVKRKWWNPSVFHQKRYKTLIASPIPRRSDSQMKSIIRSWNSCFGSPFYYTGSPG